MTTSALEINDLTVGYGAAEHALSDVSMVVPEGGFVSLLGTNGAGKSTTLKAVTGLLKFENGQIRKGRILYRGDDITAKPSYQLARRGILMVREGRFVFPTMSVEENLDAALFARGDRGPKIAKRNYDEIFHYFPALADRRKSRAGYLSGGEQQMLAIGRALYAQPELLLVDEASLGLAPKIAAEIFQILSLINRERQLSILVVEQNVTLALKHSEYGYVLEAGRVSAQGDRETLADREQLSKRYLGAAAH
ncbi:MAG: ABC transporter ATP-binding protein [Pseudomonadota bacterium]|nr:ABC transporter ATP-binding protein [Pseudomonadota bacterium]